MDVSETKDNVVLKAEVPGLEAKDIDVSVSADVLTIKGEKKKEEEKKEEHYLRSLYELTSSRETVGIDLM